MKRVFVIGDIHGGLKALHQVLQRAGVTPADTLIFLGDYVDGWSGSAQVIEFLITTDKQQHCIFIKGNHDVWCEEWLEAGNADRTWLQHGGEETVASYARLQGYDKQVHIDFFKAMKLYHVDEQNRLFIHAGFTAMKGLDHEKDTANFYLDRTLLETALSMNKKIRRDSLYFPKRLKLFHEIYLGHTPTLYFDEFTPVQALNLWDIDTGAAFTGKLSIMDIDTKQFWQSDEVMNLYPGEKGRNKD